MTLKGKCPNCGTTNSKNISKKHIIKHYPHVNSGNIYDYVECWYCKQKSVELKGTLDFKINRQF